MHPRAARRTFSGPWMVQRKIFGGEMTRRGHLLWLSGGLLGLFAATPGCRRRSPEQQVRDTIAALARAVEEANLKAFGKLVSEGYQDAQQQDRTAVLQLLGMHFARNPHTHLLTRVTAVEIAAGAGQPARATVVVAIGSLPMKTVEDAPRIEADVLRFELALVEQTREQWVVTGASWQAAAVQDLR